MGQVHAGRNILTKQTEHGNYVYEYDDVYRLTDVDNPIQDDEAYTYDGVGNRETASGVTGSITHNANNELTIYGEISYKYDANGNMIRKSIGAAAVNYIYDATNRLVKVEDNATQTVIAEYYYDPFGRRLWKDIGGTRTYFFYADEGLVAEYDATGTEIRSYGYQPDSTWTTDPLWLKEGGSYYWYQNDHLGTPQKLIDSGGTVVWSAQYSAFGNATINVNTVENPLRFPGQYADTETGLHYNWFRYYDPGNGRYLRTDPIGFEGDDVNLYAYVWNSPVNWRDTMGLRTCGEFKQKFFNWLKDYIPQMAKDLNVPEDLLWTLAVKEGGWSEEPIINDPENPGKKISAFLRNIRENMPFGVQDPKTGQNKKYDSLEEAIEDWKITGVGISFGDRVRGVQTIQEFIDALQCKGKPPEECRPYNTDSKEAWESLMNTLYGNLTGDEYGAGYKEVCTEPCGLEGGGSNGQ